ncbi:MAG: phosphatidate cytidylyltransferase [Rhodospirillaceae bacterium]
MKRLEYSKDGNDDSELDSQKKISNLRLRILSSLILTPSVLLMIWLGSPWFEILVSTALVLMWFEWTKMALGTAYHLCLGFSLLLVLAVLLGSVELFGLALFITGIGSLLLYFLTRILKSVGGIANASAFLWIGGTGISLIWLYLASTLGPKLILWLFVVVWVTDIGAYCFGKLIGGPKLAPIVSPGKTWAGLIGGVSCAVFWGWLFSSASGIGTTSHIVLISGFLAVSAQMGDLMISRAKRRFSVKDSGNLIPGHGGMLDRVDGLLGAAPVLSLVILILGGELLKWY